MVLAASLRVMHCRSCTTLGKSNSRSKESHKSFRRVVHSKPQNRSELYDTTISCRRDHSCPGGADPGVRLSEVGMVEDVDGIRADLKFHLLNDVEGLRQIEVEVGKSGPIQDVAPGIAKGKWRRRHKRRRVKPLLNRRIRNRSIGESIRIPGPSERTTQVRRSHRWGERLP